MNDVEHDLRKAFEAKLDAVVAPPAPAPATLARARRGRLAARAAAVGVVVIALVAGAAGVNALREEPRPAAPPTSREFVAIFPGGAYGWGSSRVMVDAETDRVCFDGGVYDASDAFFVASSPPGADRGPARTVGTFYEGVEEPPAEACASVDPGVAADALAEPEHYYLEFRRGALYALASLRPLVEAEAPPVGEVVCTDEGVEVLTPEVAAQPDGIHVRIDNRTTGAPKEFYMRGVNAGSNQAGNIRPGVNEVSHHVGPGKLYVGCFDRLDAPWDDLEDFGALDVVDPGGLWTSSGLVCGEDVRELVVRTGEPVSGRYGWEFPDYDDFARDAVAGLRPDDVLERPGYPATGFHFEPRTVVRDGERVAELLFVRKPDEGWLIDVDACPGSGIEGA